jgi:hypothetical protein
MTGSTIRRRGLLAAAALLLALLPMTLPLAGARAADPAAEAFLHEIYSQYGGADTPGVALDTDDALNRYFEPELVALLVKDMDEANKNNEVPKLDGDPFIDAQDWDITQLAIAVADAGADRAEATVSFQNFKQPKTVKLDLVKRDGQWKIHDIHWPEGSLRDLLTSP